MVENIPPLLKKKLIEELYILGSLFSYSKIMKSLLIENPLSVKSFNLIVEYELMFGLVFAIEQIRIRNKINIFFILFM